MAKPGRPKSETEMGDIHFTLEASEKKKWMEYSDKLGIPLSKAIKEAMDKAMYKNGTQENQNGKIDKLIKIQQEERDKLNEISQRYFEMIDDLSKRKKDNGDKSEESEELKSRILILLKRTQMQREEIETILNLEKKNLRIILGEMKNDGQINYDPESKLWGVN